LNGSCDEVTRSRYSRFFGVPVELLGVLYYGGVSAFYIFYKLVFGVAIHPTTLFITSAVTCFAFIFSLYLVFIQSFVLRKWCTWCLFSAGFSTLIFIVVMSSVQIDFIALLAKYRTVVIVLHALAAAVGLGTATITDVFFFRFLKDYRISKDEHELMTTLSNIIWCALGIMVVTGIGLFLPKADIFLHSSKFLLKMTALLVIIVNGGFLNLLISPKMMELDFTGAHDHEKGELRFMRKLSFALGAISITSWYLVFMLGLLKSIPLDYRLAVVLYVALLFGAIGMSQVVERNMRRNSRKNP
jgi:uncharacterized membrane protein